MNKKPGRNECCHCGSGKKYKNCCLNKDVEKMHSASQEEFEKEFENMKTGTMLDEYMILLRGLNMFLAKEMQFGENSRELKKVSKEFDRQFMPDRPGGVPGTYETNWLLFDLRCGKTKETTAERFMKSEYFVDLQHPGPQCVKNMADSHLSFYRVIEVGKESAVFEDLYLENEKNHVHLFDGEFTSDMRPGQIWFTRLYGIAEESFIASKPYFFDKEEAEKLKLNLINMIIAFDKIHQGNTYDKKEKFRRMMKETVTFWSNYMIRGEYPH